MSMFTRQRKVAEAPKFAGRLSVPRLLRITADIPFRTSSKVKRSKIKVTRPLWVAAQVTTCRHILWRPQYRPHSSCYRLLQQFSSSRSRMAVERQLNIYIPCVPKKLWSRTLAITLSNLNRFQKFLHCCKEKEISNKSF